MRVGLESRLVSEAVAYALEVAPGDVADTIRWLDVQGFGLHGERGGRRESFGNVLLEFERAGIRIAIVRDRSQWMVSIAASDGATAYALESWLLAMRGEKAAPSRRRRPFVSPLADQLPEGESWQAGVPAVIEWITHADRTPEITAAEQDRRRAMREYLNSPRKPV